MNGGASSQQVRERVAYAGFSCIHLKLVGYWYVSQLGQGVFRVKARPVRGNSMSFCPVRRPEKDVRI